LILLVFFYRKFGQTITLKVKTHGIKAAGKINSFSMVAMISCTFDNCKISALQSPDVSDLFRINT